MSITLPLYDGNDIPQLGLASFRSDSLKDTKEIVTRAFQKGIRHYELCELYGNAHLIMEALNECLVSNNMTRDQLFITLKLWSKNKKLNDIILGCRNVLYYCGLSYVDLLCVHAPIDIENRSDQWAALEKLKEDGICKSLGAVDLTSVQLTDLLKNCVIIPSTFELEVSPFNPKAEQCEFLNDSSMVVIVNEGLAKNLRLSHTIFKEYNYWINPEIIMIRWLVTKGYAVLLPPNNSVINQMDIGTLLQPLDQDAMNLYKNLDENLHTQWHAIEPETD